MKKWIKKFVAWVAFCIAVPNLIGQGIFVGQRLIEDNPQVTHWTGPVLVLLAAVLLLLWYHWKDVRK